MAKVYLFKVKNDYYTEYIKLKGRKTTVRNKRSIIV